MAAFSTPAEFLRQYDARIPGCLVLDLQLPELNGLDLIDRLGAGCQHPFIVITGHGQVPDATRAMRMGALNFLEKPLDRQIFIEDIQRAIRLDAEWREQTSRREAIRQRLASLSNRERQVMELVVAGRLTKQIARQLGVSIKTIEAHRSNITKKLQVQSVTQLVRLIIEYAHLQTPPVWQAQRLSSPVGRATGSGF